MIVVTASGAKTGTRVIEGGAGVERFLLYLYASPPS